MIILLLIALMIIAGLSLPAINKTKKHKSLSLWDYAYPSLGIPLWFALTIFKVSQTATLSNFVVENFWITLVSIGAPWIVLLIYKLRNRSMLVMANLLTLLPMVFTVAIRLLINSLPE
jgi:hypothetical protein